MKDYFKYALGLIGAIALSVFCLGFSCNKPVEPVEPKDYVLYAHNSAVVPPQYLAYHTATGILDSFALAVQPAGVLVNESPLAVSPDGSLLYVATSSSNVTIIDSETRQVVEQLPYDATEVQVSPNGKYAAIHGWRHQLWILETEDYNLVYFDSGSYSEGRFQIGRFSESSNSYYCTDYTDTGTVVYKIDFVSDSIPLKKLFSAIEIIPSLDETIWYMYLYHGNAIFEFAVYDLSSDSIIFSDVFSPGSGWMEISPDGRYVFYTYPGGMIGPPPTRYSLSVYDTYKNEITKVIPGRFVDSIGDTSLFRPAELAVTPDGCRLIALQVDGVGRFLVIDVNKLEVFEYFESNIVAMNYLAIQGKP